MDMTEKSGADIVRGDLWGLRKVSLDEAAQAIQLSGPLAHLARVFDAETLEEIKPPK